MNHSQSGLPTEEERPYHKIFPLLVFSLLTAGIYALYRLWKISLYAAKDQREIKQNEYLMLAATSLYFLSEILQDYFDFGYLTLILALVAAALYYLILLQVANFLVRNRAYDFKLWLLAIFGPFYLQYKVNEAPRYLGRRLTPSGIAVFALIAFVSANYGLTLSRVRVHSNSMNPNIVWGDRVLVNVGVFPSGWQPEAGELVVIKNPLDKKESSIRRVAAKAGDIVRYGRTRLQINGVEICTKQGENARYECKLGTRRFQVLNYDPTNESEQDLKTVEIESSQYFMISDNFAEKEDSREFGPLKRSDIKGSVLKVLYSMTNFTFDPERFLLNL